MGNDVSLELRKPSNAGQSIAYRSSKQNIGQVEFSIRLLARRAGISQLVMNVHSEDTVCNACEIDLHGMHNLNINDRLLCLLDRDELKAVAAHEMGHIAYKRLNRGIKAAVSNSRDLTKYLLFSALVGEVLKVTADTLYLGSVYASPWLERCSDSLSFGIVLLSGLVVSAAGFASATTLDLFFSRKRESFADAYSAKLTRHPEHLASALVKLAAYERDLGTCIKIPELSGLRAYVSNAPRPGQDNNSINEIANKKMQTLLDKAKALFMTHPPLYKRVSDLGKIKDAEGSKRI